MWPRKLMMPTPSSVTGVSIWSVCRSSFPERIARVANDWMLTVFLLRRLPLRAPAGEGSEETPGTRCNPGPDFLRGRLR